MVGSTEPDGTDADIWVVRTDASGFTDWTLTYGNTITENDIDHGKAIEQTPDGGYIVAGDTFSEDPGTNVRLLRFDGSGIVAMELHLLKYEPRLRRGCGGRWWVSCGRYICFFPYNQPGCATNPYRFIWHFDRDSNPMLNLTMTVVMQLQPHPMVDMPWPA